MAGYTPLLRQQDSKGQFRLGDRSGHVAALGAVPGGRNSTQHASDVGRSSRKMQLAITVGARQLAAPELQSKQSIVQQQWADFRESGLVEGLESLQSLRNQLSMSNYQQLVKDVEPQDTAGLDVALADTLSKLAQQTQLGDTQAWLKAQTTAEVLKVLNGLQHPPDCAPARKLVCALDKGCGFGCQMHHVVHCLRHAVALNKTMVLKTDPWSYSPRSKGTDTWLELMAPVSSCGMHHLSTNDTQNLPAIAEGQWHEHEQEVFLGIIDRVHTSVDVPAMPPDVLQLVQLFNSRPQTWWVGVLSSYILRPSAASLERLAAYRRDHSWASPVIGVHIRRTDKVTSGEAILHSVGEYMLHVERYCDWRHGSGWQQAQTAASKESETGTDDAVRLRRLPDSGRCTVYLATDEPEVVQETVKDYPHIQVITNLLSLATGGTRKRNTEVGAQGVYDDILLLSSTDYLVGTFSSQVSRLAYEIAQVNGTGSMYTAGAQMQVTDPTLHYHSVDSMWYYGGMTHYEFCTTHVRARKRGTDSQACTC